MIRKEMLEFKDINMRTDLAIEVSEALQKGNQTSGIPGVSVKRFENTEDEIRITTVESR